MRHKPETIELARRLFEDGYTIQDIRRVFAKSGINLAWHVVKRWVDADYREHTNRLQRHKNGRRRGDRRTGGEYTRQKARELRARGLTFEAISVVLDIYHDRQISPESVRHIFRYDRAQQEASK